MTKIVNPKTTQTISSGIILSLATCFMLFLYSPLELYFNNKNEFWFDVYTLLPVITITFLLFFFVSVLCFYFAYRIHTKIYQICLVLYFVAFVSFYVQGNYLISNLPPLNASVIDWHQYPMERLKSIMLWISASCLVVILVKLIHFNKFYRFVKIVSTFISLMLLVTVLTLCITQKGYEKKPYLTATDDNLFQLSQDTNFIILLLDATDGCEFSQVLNSSPEYKEIFEDFTYYENTLGAYPHTKLSIPFILSGEWYENSEPFTDYTENIIADSELFNALNDVNYKIGMYTEDLLLTSDASLRFDNVTLAPRGTNSSVTFAKWQILLTGFKYLPFDLKQFSYVHSGNFNALRNIPTGDGQPFTCSNSTFYNALKNTDFSYTADKCFKFIHLEGAHVPFQYDKDMNTIENGTYTQMIEASMTLSASFLQKLKDNDVYDNTIIIILADHGYNDSSILLKQHPILLIKGLNESHELQFSKAPISFADLTTAYSRLLAGNSSVSVFDYQENDQRKRRYLYYDYNEESHLIEYYQSGEVDNMETFLPSGQEYNY